MSFPAGQLRELANAQGGPVVDPDLALPMRHEAIARRVAELVTAELAPGMIPGILGAAHALAPLWEAVTLYNGGRYQFYLSPAGIGQHVLAPLLSVDARTRTLTWTLDVDGWRVWAGTLQDLSSSGP